MPRHASVEGLGYRVDTGDPVMTVLRGGATLDLRGSITVDKHRTPSRDVSAAVLEDVRRVDGSPLLDDEGRAITKALTLKAAGWHEDGTAVQWIDVETGASLVVIG